MGNKKYEYGEIKEYKDGDVVVWGGRKPCIGKIECRGNEDLHRDCWVIDEEHNSLHYSNLRYATHEEIKQLGDRQKLLIAKMKDRKEEILGLSFYPHECGSMIDCCSRQDALKSMEQYAEEMAVGFAEFYQDVVYKYINIERYAEYHPEHIEDGKLKLPTQLYQQYLESIK